MKLVFLVGRTTRLMLAVTRMLFMVLYIMVLFIVTHNISPFLQKSRFSFFFKDRTYAV